MANKLPNNQKQPSKHPIKRLIIFQLRLMADAIRDLVLSPASIICTILDMVSRNKQIGYYDRLMKLGRESDVRINLFEQHGDDVQSVDFVLNEVESVIKKRYRDKDAANKALAAIKKTLKRDGKAL